MSVDAIRHGKRRPHAQDARSVSEHLRREHRGARASHNLDEEFRRHGAAPPVARLVRVDALDDKIVQALLAFREQQRESRAMSGGVSASAIRDDAVAAAPENRAGSTFRFLIAGVLRTRDAMQRGIRRLSGSAGRITGVLRGALLHSTGTREHAASRWQGASDFRIICECQRHAIRERSLWRRSLRAAEHFKHGGAVLLVGLPLVFGIADFPIEATSGAAVETRASNPRSSNPFPIFTTLRVRSEFLEPPTEARAFTLEATKEEFFRTHVPYGSIIYREAKKNQLAPELIAAVVETESDFRPRLISQKNAQGLMQIVPGTGELLGAGNLFDPEQNVAAGSRYLKYLLDRFGNLRLALAAYNAGEGNIDKFGGVPPFPETLNYVQRVSSSTRWYRQRVRETFLASSRVRTSYAH